MTTRLSADIENSVPLLAPSNSTVFEAVHHGGKAAHYSHILRDAFSSFATWTWSRVGQLELIYYEVAAVSRSHASTPAKIDYQSTRASSSQFLTWITRALLLIISVSLDSVKLPKTWSSEDWCKDI